MQPGKPTVTYTLDYSHFVPAAGEFHDYDVIDDVRSAPDQHVTTGTGM